MNRRSDRIAGLVGLLTAVAIALEARGFTVDFLTDPLGPKALPLFGAAMLAGGALLVLLRPEPSPSWPDAGGRVRLLLAAVSLFLYAGLLLPLGFFPATALAGAAVSRLFGGKWWQTVLVGVVASALLFALFGWALGIALPAGTLWRGLGG